MTKDEAIHKALKVLNCLNNDRVYETAWVKGAINACEEALEQPTVAELNDEYLRDTNVIGLEQPAEPRLVSYALDGSTCTLNIDGEEVYFNREQPAQEPLTRAQQVIRANNTAQPAQEPVATIQQFERKWIDKEALEQPAEPRLVSYALDGSTCTLNIDGEEVYFNREQPAQEPVALLEALSDLEHQQWIKWAKSIIDSEPISEARKQRWITMMVDYKDLPDNIQEYDREWARKVMALYTHPHQWQGLTDDEIQELTHDGVADEYDIKFARAVLAKAKEKNHG